MNDFINFNLENVKEKLNTKILGREIIYLEEVESTQEYIKSNLRNNLKDRHNRDNRKTNKGSWELVHSRSSDIWDVEASLHYKLGQR